MRKEEIKVTQGSQNVFADLGFDAEESQNLKIGADLILDFSPADSNELNE